MTHKKSRRKKDPKLFKGEKVSFKVTTSERKKFESMAKRSRLSFGRMIVKKLITDKKRKRKRRRSTNAGK